MIVKMSLFKSGTLWTFHYTHHPCRKMNDTQLLYKKSRCTSEVNCHRDNAGEGVESRPQAWDSLTSFQPAKARQDVATCFPCFDIKIVIKTCCHFPSAPCSTLASWLRSAIFSVLTSFCWTEL